MRFSKTLSLSVLITIVAACSQGSSTPLANAIKANTNMPAAAAECMGELADKELKPGTVAFLAASMTQDQAETEKYQDKMTLEDLNKAGNFMASAASRCGLDKSE